MSKRCFSLPGLALNFAGADAPEWIELIPAGPRILGRDGRWWTMPDAGAVVSRFDPAKEPQIDIEHSSQMLAPQGMPAPAVGWVKALEVREGAVWGRIEWTQKGAELVGGRAYRYLSPVFRFDPATNEISEFVCAGLTNNPNLEMAALNSAGMETETMDKTILDALGLPGAASVADAMTAIAALKSEKQIALNAAQHPDPANWVPRADHQLALNRIGEFETADKARAEAEAVGAVDAAITEGKISPASRDYHLATCRAEGGLDRFKTFVAAQPVIAGKSGLDGKDPAQQLGKLNPEELAVCRQLGMSAEDFAAARAAEGKE